VRGSAGPAAEEAPVGYHVEFTEPVLDYLARVDGLTDEDREAIVVAVTEELARDADRFLALRPLAHESLCFLYDYPHPTEQAIYDFDFVVDASHLEMGVVRVAYVECDRKPMQ
jgi:hypothetical protein